MAIAMHVALVSEGVNIPTTALTRVAAGLSKQVQNDFRSIWNVDATVEAFVSLEDVPTDYWPIIVIPDVKDAAGYHQDQNGQPFSLVEFGDHWSLTASHECLEMLADPFGGRLRAGNLSDQAIELGLAPARVRYLIEVCDPSESGEFGYLVNGVLVSDFYTPHYFDPVKSSGVRYSFTGAIDAPRKVLAGGYLSWLAPNNHWFQLRMFPDAISKAVPHVLDLSTQTKFESIKREGGLRAAMDRVTIPPTYREGLAASPLMAAFTERKSLDQEAQETRAQELRELVQQLLKPA